VQGPPEPGGPTAPEPASGQPPGQAPPTPFTSGAGLYDHAAADPFPRAAGLVSGLVALGVTIAVAGAFWFLNPAFSTGRAAGAPDQLGPRAVASPSVAGSPSVAASPAVSGSPSVSASPGVSASPAVVRASPSAVVSPLPGPSPSPVNR
jgi:hypothetical protein